MDLGDLDIFRTVVQAGGVSRAAEKLNRVQSNVTTRVRQLEADLGVALFIREGKRLDSQVLLADSANTSADVYVTLSVLASMGLVVALGWQWADIVAALIITVLIGRAAWEVLSQTGRVLVDTAPYPSDKLAQLIHEVPSVENVARVRSRGRCRLAASRILPIG